MAVIASVAVTTSLSSATARAAETSGFHGLVPARVLDTRTGVGVPVGKIGPGQSVALQVAGRGGVPAAGAIAVVLNVTVTEPDSSGYVTAWPAAEPRPEASNLNFIAGQTIPNLVIVKLDGNGQIGLFNSAGTTHLLADVSGWYDSSAQLVATNPTRLLDTRTGLGASVGRKSGTNTVQVAGAAGVPLAGATSVIVNVTVAEPNCGGYLSVWPTGASQPNASNLNFSAGETRPNLAIVKLGSEGKISYNVSCGSAHVLMDIMGYITSDPHLADLLDPVANTCCWSEGQFPLNGQNRFNSVEHNYPVGSSPDWVEYNLGRRWATLSTAFTYDDVHAPVTSSVRFRILGDGVELANQTVTFGQYVPVSVNVSGVLRLRLEVTRNGTVDSGYPAFADPRLSAVPRASAPPDPDYFALVPSRILDTRSGVGAAQARVPANAAIEVAVLGQGGVPTAGVVAAVLNVTATSTDSDGYVTVWPSGPTRPEASNLNFAAGSTVANLVVAPIGDNGRASFFVAGSPAHLIADVLGYYVVPSATTSALQPRKVFMTSELDSVAGTCCWAEGQFPINGENRFNSLVHNYPVGSSPDWTEYNLSRQWSTLSTAFSYEDVHAPATSSVRFRVLGDGIELANQTVAFGQYVPVTVNVAGVLRLRLEVTRNGTANSGYPAFTDPVLARP